MKKMKFLGPRCRIELSRYAGYEPWSVWSAVYREVLMALYLLHN